MTYVYKPTSHSHSMKKVQKDSEKPKCYAKGELNYPVGEVSMLS